jgi:hypothetical protein
MIMKKRKILAVGTVVAGLVSGTALASYPADARHKLLDREKWENDLLAAADEAEAAYMDRMGGYAAKRVEHMKLDTEFRDKDKGCAKVRGEYTVPVGPDGMPIEKKPYLRTRIPYNENVHGTLDKASERYHIFTDVVYDYYSKECRDRMLQLDSVKNTYKLLENNYKAGLVVRESVERARKEREGPSYWLSKEGGGVIRIKVGEDEDITQITP